MSVSGIPPFLLIYLGSTPLYEARWSRQEARHIAEEFTLHFHVLLDDDRSGSLVLSFRRHGEDVHQTIDLIGTPQPFGGSRWLARCPWSGDPVAKLYLPAYGRARRFLSRGAHGLAYHSQRVGVIARDTNRRYMAARRLGGTNCIDVPERPKGMHWRTYDRLVANLHHIHPAADAAGLRSVRRVLRRYSV